MFLEAPHPDYSQQILKKELLAQTVTMPKGLTKTPSLQLSE